MLQTLSVTGDQLAAGDLIISPNPRFVRSAVPAPDPWMRVFYGAGAQQVRSSSTVGDARQAELLPPVVYGPADAFVVVRQTVAAGVA